MVNNITYGFFAVYALVALGTFWFVYAASRWTVFKPEEFVSWLFSVILVSFLWPIYWAGIGWLYVQEWWEYLKDWWKKCHTK